MKRISSIALFLAILFLFSGCKKENESLLTQLIGDWELTEYEVSTKSITIGEETINVNISFVMEEYGFYLRQSIGEGFIKTFYGSWTLSGNTLTGKYSDDTSWGNIYTIDIVDNNKLIMVTEDKSETYSYTRVQ
jgi:hypothetical protein